MEESEARPGLIPAISLFEILGASFLCIMFTLICPTPAQDGAFRMLMGCLQLPSKVGSLLLTVEETGSERPFEFYLHSCGVPS